MYYPVNLPDTNKNKNNTGNNSVQRGENESRKTYLPCESPRHVSKPNGKKEKQKSGSERGEREFKNSFYPVNLPDTKCVTRSRIKCCDYEGRTTTHYHHTPPICHITIRPYYIKHYHKTSISNMTPIYHIYKNIKNDKNGKS